MKLSVRGEYALRALIVLGLNADQAVVNLKMSRRDQQIALASALGGGYVDTAAPNRGSQSHQEN